MTFPAWGTTGRAIIQADTNENTIATTFDTSIGEQNTGDPASLSSFINWAKTAAPANHYGLVLWDHGNGDLGGFNAENFKPNTGLGKQVLANSVTNLYI